MSYSLKNASDYSRFQTTILRTFFNTFSPLHKCYLNALYGDCEVNFFLHYGQYVSMNDAFFDKDKSPEFSWRLVLTEILTQRKFRMSDQCCRHSFKTCRDMKHMGIREREFAAICAIGLANDSKSLPIKTTLSFCFPKSKTTLFQRF